MKTDQGDAKDEKKDAELKSLNSCDNGQEKESEGEEKTNDTEETTPLADETKKQNFGERVASFFRLRKTQSLTEEKDLEAGDEKETEEVDATKAEAEKTEAADKTAEGEKTGADTEETSPLADETKKQNFGERVASFFRLRKTQSLTEEQDLEAGEKKETEDVDATKAEAEKTEVVVEEDNEKGEKDVEEKEKSLIKTNKTDLMSCWAGLCNSGEKKEESEPTQEEGNKEETETKKEEEKQVNSL